jgi:hypothetical protein
MNWSSLWEMIQARQKVETWKLFWLPFLTVGEGDSEEHALFDGMSTNLILLSPYLLCFLFDLKWAFFIVTKTDENANHYWLDKTSTYYLLK